MIHHIRRSILDKLATTETMRYGELKPTNLDGNVFNYHLKGLIADDYVLKNEEGDYSLTHLGRDYIVHRYENPAESAHSIFLIVLKRGSEYLVRRRKVQPLLDYAGFLHGEPEAGVELIETASKRLLDKTGIANVKLSVVGSALISQYYDDELQSFSQAVIVYGETEQNISIEEDSTGSNFWSDLDTEKVFPSCKDILGMIDANESWIEGQYEV